MEPPYIPTLDSILQYEDQKDNDEEFEEFKNETMFLMASKGEQPLQVTNSAMHHHESNQQAHLENIPEIPD